MSLTPNLPEPLEDVLADLAAQPNAWVRLAVARYDDSWEVEVCDIVTGAPPDSWKAERLIDGDGVFIAIRTEGATVTRWLSQGRSRLSGTTMVIPTLNPNPQVQRRSVAPKTSMNTRAGRQSEPTSSEQCPRRIGSSPRGCSLARTCRRFPISKPLPVISFEMDHLLKARSIGVSAIDISTPVLGLPWLSTPMKTFGSQLKATISQA